MAKNNWVSDGNIKYNWSTRELEIEDQVVMLINNSSSYDNAYVNVLRNDLEPNFIKVVRNHYFNGLCPSSTIAHPFMFK